MVIFPVAFFSVVAVVWGVTAFVGHDHKRGMWIGVAVPCVIALGIARRLRARFDLAGVHGQNAFRSRSFTWSEIAAIRVTPAVWYCGDPSWAAAMLEVTTVNGERFPLRVCTHLKRSQADALSAFLQARAAEHGSKHRHR